jgi:hypothetical protein
VDDVERPIRRPNANAFPALRRHSRVSPQPSVCRPPCPPSPVGRPFRTRTDTRLRTAGCVELVTTSKPAATLPFEGKPAAHRTSRRGLARPEDRAGHTPDEPAWTGPIPLDRRPSSQHPTHPRGRPPKRLHRPRIGGPRSRNEPEGSHRTAPSARSRPKPRVGAAELPRRLRWQAITTIERTRGVELIGDDTQVPWPIVVSPNSEPPTRLSGESQSSHRESPSDVTPTGTHDTPSLCSAATVDRRRSRARGKPRGVQ